MGSGEKHNMVSILHLFNLHNLLHHHHHDDHHDNHKMKGVPKGCMAIMVGHEGEEQLKRFIIPIFYVNHPLFIKLLNDAQEEYGFKHKGPIIIPCHVEDFLRVQSLIDHEQHNNHHNHNDHHHHHNFLCFKA
ncbi:hypothetical protein RND81_14G095400 [Saponaria officinalis]|uniref:Uncharacterized protein n=1 Tax=Saponaria officinalis TaxID=3572 RepID=A0AAW1GQI0_SAPOF